MERLGVAFAVDGAADDGTFTGMASVFDTLIDTWIPTRIKAGAFTDTLKDTRRVKVLREHNEPIGKPVELQERATGLWIKGKITTAIPLGAETLALMREGVLDEMSIGFDPIEYHMTKDGNDDVRIITKAKLWEVSIVTWGANRDAKIESVHAAVARTGVPDWLRALVPVVGMAKPAAGWPEAEQSIARRAVLAIEALGLVGPAPAAAPLTILPANAPADVAARTAAIATRLAALDKLRPAGAR
jgi:hypothetical protein